MVQAWDVGRGWQGYLFLNLDLCFFRKAAILSNGIGLTEGIVFEVSANLELVKDRGCGRMDRHYRPIKVMFYNKMHGATDKFFALADAPKMAR